MDSYLKYLFLIISATGSVYLLSKFDKQLPTDIPDEPESSVLEFLSQMETKFHLYPQYSISEIIYVFLLI